MLQPIKADRPSYRHRSMRRHGAMRGRLLMGLAAAVAIAAAVWQFGFGGSHRSTANAPLTADVKQGTFTHEVVERGDLESSSNVEVRCEVQTRGGNGGVAILELIDEGTTVKQGDLLIRLDDSMLQAELVQQQILCNTSEAEVIQAESTLTTAKLAKQEYESGTFEEGEELLQSEEFVAEENMRRAEEYLQYSERLAAKGYITPIQLEADRFAVEKARKELDVAHTKLKVLRTYTKQKMLSQLEADIKTAEAQLRAQQDSLRLDQTRLELIKTQIAKCQIHAPADGQVVYANDGIPMEEGRVVRERQLLVMLPDPKRMQVRARINESRVDLVQVGMKTRVHIDAMPGVELAGTVKRVSEYPLPTSSYNAHVKEYATYLEIEKPVVGLRPGMTAEVTIEVEKAPDAVQAPVQAIVERDGRHFCLLTSAEGEMEAREVLIGSTNDKHVVIREGLDSSDKVVLTPQAFIDEVPLPEARTFSVQQAVARYYEDEQPEDAPGNEVHEVAVEPAAPKRHKVRKPLVETAVAVEQPHAGGGL